MDGDTAVSDDRSLEVACAAADATPPVRRDLSRLTLGERLWLWRRSITSVAHSRRGVSVHTPNKKVNRAVPSNQVEAATHLGLDVSAYWAAEHGALPDWKVLALLIKVEEPEYTLPDALRVARRRSPLKLSQVAVGAGVGSRPTFYKLEAAGDQRVVAFWRKQGFRFPRKFPIQLRVPRAVR